MDGHACLFLSVALAVSLYLYVQKFTNGLVDLVEGIAAVQNLLRHSAHERHRSGHI